MNFVIAAVFDNYINAHLTLGRLQEENINCWLKDEHTVTVLTHASGIKLMVAEPQIERALMIINSDRENYKAQHACTQCGSTNIELVSAPMPIHKVYHCFDCGNEYEME